MDNGQSGVNGQIAQNTLTLLDCLIGRGEERGFVTILIPSMEVIFAMVTK